MKETGYSVALIGASGVVGGEILKALEERNFPLASLSAYASLRTAGELVACGGLSARIDPLGDAARFNDTDIVFLAAGEQISAEWAGRIAEAGAVVIDVSGLFTDDPEVPLIVPEVNPTDISRHVDRGLISTPDPAAIALAVVLAPLHTLASLHRVAVTTFEPVSGAGRGGIEELERQTVDLMGGRSPDEKIFPRRVAFNVLPQVGELLEGGISRGEQQTAAAVRRLLEDPELCIHVTRVRAPLFYGACLAVNIELGVRLGLDEVRDALREAPGVFLQDDAGESGYSTAADSVGQDTISVGRLRVDPELPILNLWLSLDNTRKGAAVNAVQIAEILIREYL
jgi:aspartate-semialdehyde dehydrogenase